MEARTYDCPNCSAPARVPLGEVETVCEYCGSHLRFLPDEREMEVVRTREEMKRRERVAVHKAMLRKQLEQEELARWRETAGKVAIAALPIVGDVAGRALFRSAIHRGGGCAGCGCIVLVAVGLALVSALGATLGH
jgi:DNA-directed RNA polymerase subunit RPC12/RpoP